MAETGGESPVGVSSDPSSASLHSSDTGHDEDYEEEEEESSDDSEERDTDTGELGQRHERMQSGSSENVRKMKKLASLFAMVQSMKKSIKDENVDDVTVEGEEDKAGIRRKVKTRKAARISEPVICDHCPESFVCFSSLNSHSRREHGVNLLQCPECGRECSSLNLLRVHVKVSAVKRFIGCTAGFHNHGEGPY